MFWSRNIWTKDISRWKVKISCLRLFIWMFRRTVEISFVVEFSVWFDMIMLLNRKNIWFWLISLYFLILWHGHLSKLVKISSILLHNFQNCYLDLNWLSFIQRFYVNVKKTLLTEFHLPLFFLALWKFVAP